MFAFADDRLGIAGEDGDLSRCACRVQLVADTSPNTAMMEHVITCLTGHANHIEPASALPTLELALEVHQRLTEAAG